MRRNAAPRWEYLGTQDLSARTPPVIPEQMPQHLPIIYTFAADGPYNEPVYGYGDILLSIFGQNLLDYRASHITHAIPLIDVLNRAANKMAIVRLPAPGTARARFALGLDLLQVELPVYETTEEGFWVRDNTGARIATGDTVIGWRARWVAFPVGSVEFGRLEPVAGGMSDGENQSTIYPICELLASHDSDLANLTGFRLYAPTTTHPAPLNVDVVEDQKSMLYRMQVVRKPTVKSSPFVWETLTAAQWVDFAFNPEAINEALDTDLFVDEVLLQSYRDLKLNANGVSTYGPFEQIKWYHDDIANVSAMIQTSESTFGKLSNAADDLYLTNIIGLAYNNGAPYQSVDVQGVLAGGLELSDIATHYLAGGSSGATTPANFEQAVLDAVLTFGEGDIKWRNIAKYPAHQFYDTGFTLQVKNVLPRITAVRNNIAVYLATHIHGMPAMNMADESSMAVALNSRMQAYPESVIFGTTFMRGAICAGSGTMVNSKYKPRCAATIDLAYKKARYQGASNGAWKSVEAYDQDGKNHVNILENLNNTYRPDEVRNRDWANGVIYWQDYDRSTAFYPGLQTAYVDDTSVLNSEMVMSAILFLTTTTFNVWKRLTGNQKLTVDQLIERSNELILADTQDMFDGRFVIRPETFLTPVDTILGYQWSCKVHIYANNMRTVFAAAVIAHRMEDLV